MLKIFFLILSVFVSTYHLVHSQYSWNLHKEKDESKLYIFKDKSSGINHFKIETTTAGTYDKVFEIFTNIEKLPTWYDKILKVELLQQISPIHAKYKIEYQIQSPYKNRFAAVEAKMKPNAGTKTIELSIKNIANASIDKKYEDRLIKKLEVLWTIKEITPGIVKVSYSGFLDPDISAPTFLINKEVNSSPFVTIANFKKILNNSL